MRTTSTSSPSRPPPPIPLPPAPPPAPGQGGGRRLSSRPGTPPAQGSRVLRTTPGPPSRQDPQGSVTPAGHDLAPLGGSAPPHAALHSALTGMPRPDPPARRTSGGPDLASCGRRGAQRIRAPSEHHCLALLDHSNSALGWPSLSGHKGASSSPPRANGGAHARTWRAVSVSQRLTSPVPALLACDFCHCPYLRGTSTGGAQRPAGAAEGEWGGGSGRRDRHGAGSALVSESSSLRLPTPPPGQQVPPYSSTRDSSQVQCHREEGTWPTTPAIEHTDNKHR